MQVIILAAGQSSRFSPYNSLSHKSLVGIMGKPVALHTIESVRKSGTNDIILVVSKNSQIQELLGDGKKYGVNIRYVIQDSPTGSGNGLLLARDYIAGDFFLLNISRVDFDEFKQLMTSKKNKNTEGVLLGKKEKNLAKYGVISVRGDRVLDLVEKPLRGKEPSDIRLVGIYLFSKNFLKVLDKTPDEHYRLEKAISDFCKSEVVEFVLAKKETPSLKYSWDLLEVKDYLLSKIKGKNISDTARISKSAEIFGDVVIEDDVTVMEGAKIKGPCFIGKGSVIGNNVILRNGVDIEENCVVGANLEIKNSLIMKNTKVHSGFIGDSVIGENVRIGAQFSSANKRIDREAISVISQKGEKVDTGIKSLGVIVGNNVKMGIKVSTMPGIIIGEGSIIGPSTTVLKNVSPNSKYYTKFQEVVENK